MPVEEVLIGAEEKGAGAAGGVEDFELGDLGWGFAFDEFADGVFDNVLDDVGGCVIDTAGLFDFGLFLDAGVMAGREGDDLAEELLIDLAEDFSGQDGKFVGAFGIVERFEDGFEDFVVDGQRGSQFVGTFGTIFFVAEVEQAGVVTVIGGAETRKQTRIDIGAVDKGQKLAVSFDAAVFGDPQEDDAVDGDLNGEVELAIVEGGVAEGDVVGERVAPGFDLGEEGIIDFGGTAFGLFGAGVFVEGTLEDGVAGEDGGNLIPAGRVVGVGDELNAGSRGLVGMDRTDAAVIDGKLLEIGEDGQGQLGGPGVAAELECGGGVFLDINGGLFGFEEEFSSAADAETVVGGLGGRSDLDGVLVDDILIGVGIAAGIVDIPAEGIEEGIEEFAAELGFVVSAGAVVVAAALETLDKLINDSGSRHRSSSF